MTLIALGVAVVAVLWSGSMPATAATTTTAPCATPAILGGLSATGATVTTPGAEVRRLDRDQATAFMQTWLAYSVFQSPPQERPPANLPVSHLDVATIQNGQVQPLLIYYASNGTAAWVGAPAPTPAPPPDDQKWIRAPNPADTIAAFAGRLAPKCVAAPTAASTTAAETPTTRGLAVEPKATSSGGGAPVALIVAGVVVVVGGGALFAFSLARRRRVA